MAEDAAPDWIAFITELLNCPPDDLETWVESHRAQLKLEFLEAIKNYVNQNKISHPDVVDRITHHALFVADQMLDEPLAAPTAAWARGIWETFYAPRSAIEQYQRALAGYEKSSGRTREVASLLTNLIYVLSECGRFQEAEAAYLRALAIFENLEEKEPKSLFVLKQSYGLLLHNWGRYSEALTAYQQAQELVPRLKKSEQSVQNTHVLVNHTMSLAMLGRLSEGEAILLKERDNAQANKQTLTIARIDMNLGNIYTALGQPALALRRFQSAREAFAQANNQMEVGSVFLREGALFRRIGAEHLARRSYIQAQTEFKQQKMWLQLAQALFQQAVLERTFGKFSQAKLLLDQAEAIWKPLKQVYWLTQVQFERIELALLQRDGATALQQLNVLEPIENNIALSAQRDLLSAEALRLLTDQPAAQENAKQAYKRVLDYALSQGERWMQRRAMAGLGQLLLTYQSQTDESNVAVLEQNPGQRLLEQAIDHDDQTRQMLSVEELKASFQAQSSDLLPILARWAVNQNEPRLALSYIWRAKSSAFADLRQSIEVEQTGKSDVKMKIHQTRQDLAAWYLKREKATEFSPNREVINKTIQELKWSLFDLRRRRNYQQLVENARLFDDPAQWLGRMDADVLLEYICCEGELLGVCADRSGACHTVWLGKVSEIRQEMSKLQLNFDNVSERTPEQRCLYGNQWRAECLPVLERLYTLLMAPLLITLEQPTTHQRLLIAPCDPLSLLPFSAFWDGQHHLVERYQLEFIASGGLLAVPGIAKPEQTPAPPVIITASAEGRLAATRSEVFAVVGALPCCVCLIDTPKAIDYLTRLSPPPRLLHIAAHTDIHQDAPILTALQLTEEWLSVEQAYELPLAGVPLAILSGCLTASGMDTGGALLAFQSAFFIAGVQRIISSLWSIIDEATPVWMQQFYRFYTSGLTPADALRQTQLLLLTDPAYKAYNHPAIWAAFMCSRC